MASLYEEGTIPTLSDSLIVTQYGTESSLDNSRRTRLLRPSGPVALATGRDFKTDSTSNGDNTMLFSGVMTVAAGKSGFPAFCSFKFIYVRTNKKISLTVLKLYSGHDFNTGV